MESHLQPLEESTLELFGPVCLSRLKECDFSDSLVNLTCCFHITGDRVRVLGEAYSPDDDEDMAMATVEAVSIPRGRSRTDVTMAKAGNWVLLDGVDANISKTATITSTAGDENSPVGDDDTHIFAPLKFPQVSCFLSQFGIVFLTRNSSQPSVSFPGRK